jgi:transitional endoplasmic reticulum ATPase
MDLFSEVMVVGATNRLDLVDPAVLNPGRLGMVVELPLPNAEERAEILALHTRQLPLAEPLDLALLARGSEGLNGAELARLCQRSAFAALQAFIEMYGPQAEASADSFVIRTADLLETLEAMSAHHGRQAAS